VVGQTDIWRAVWEWHIAFPPMVHHSGTNEMGVVFWCFFKHIIVSRPLNCLANMAQAVWDALSILPTLCQVAYR
jgi:hypothetical protein